MINFLELCERNQDRLLSQFGELLNGANSRTRKTLVEFAEAIKAKGRIGVNMRPMVLLDFLISDRWFNIHQWAKKTSARGGKPVEVILREKLRDYFDRRMAFDGFFESGLEFRYGALNIGGLGAHCFGEYCAILQKEAHRSCRVGYLKGDSLNHYMAAGPKVDDGRLRVECAADGQKDMLLALKHASEVAAKPPDQWPDMICNADCYAEAIVVEGHVKAGHLSCIRIGKVDFALYWDYAFREFSGRLSELDRYRVDAFAAIDERLQLLGVSWETV
ncbi:MAG TPA: hypothetical protein VME43_17255 [Bryobacteraceae bacterium]|nr:hypothetical protein [Bryobacteraceae bacterium]